MTKTALKETTLLNNIANEDWPALNEISAGRFKIAKKSKVTDIEAVTKGLKKISKSDDRIIANDIRKDIKENEKVEYEAESKTDHNVDSEEVDSDKNLILERSLQNENKILTKTEEENEEVITQKRIAVYPQSTKVSVVASSPNIKETALATPLEREINTENIDSVNGSKINVQGLIKFVTLGFIHLYLKKTTTVLKPVSFVAQNFEKVFVAMMHLIIPMVMTWLITTKIDFVATQLAQKDIFMALACKAVFYIACVFLWVSAQVIGSGILSMFKKTLKDVAKIGEENR